MVDVTIKVRLDGPYKVSGPAVVRDESGAVVSQGDPDDAVVLCRCGRSAAAPVCDGSHRRDNDRTAP